MPLWDYNCGKCSTTTELFFSRFVDSPNCADCGEPMTYVPSFNYTSDAQNFSPVVIHRDAEGNVRFPGRADARVPEGFKKVELCTVAEIRKFEAEMSIKDSAKADQFRASRSFFLDGQLKANREAVDQIANGGAWQGTDEKGNIITRHGLSEKGKMILARLREASMIKQAQGRSHSRPEFFVEAFSRDASNREEHRDAYTDWQRVRK